MGIRLADRAWTSYIRPQNPCGMHEILVRPQVGLMLDRMRVAVSAYDAYALQIAEWCIATRTSAVIGHPDPLNALAALVPAAAHVSRLIETNAFTDRRVAVITRDNRMRALYREFCIGAESLANVVPAVTLGNGGHLSRLGTSTSRGATYFIRSCADLGQLPAVDLVVVDAPASEMRSLEGLNVPQLYLMRDSSDFEMARVIQRLPTFAWSSADLKVTPDLVAFDGPRLSQSLARLRVLQADSTVHVVPVFASNVADNASMIWHDVGSLLLASRNSSVGRGLAQTVFKIFNDLVTLSVPMAQYEEMYGLLRPRLRAVEQSAALLRGESRETFVPSIALELHDLAEAIGQHPPKERALRRLLEPLTAVGSVAIVTRDAHISTLIHGWLEKEPRYIHSVDVVPFSAVPNMAPARSAVLLGMAPSWARHLYAAGIAQDVHVLAYATEGAAAVGGASERDIVKRTLSYQGAYSAWASRPAAKAHCWETLSGDHVGIDDDHPKPPWVKVDRDDDMTGLIAPDVPPALWDDLIQFRALEAATRDAAERDSTAHDTVLEATRLTFDDGRWALVANEGEVSLLDAASRSVEMVRVSSVKVGSVLVSIDRQTRKDVLAKVLEVSSSVPELAVAAAWMHPWRVAVSTARRRFATYRALHEALGEHGCAVQAQTVRLWIVGVTIGPDDPENVRRLGIVIGESRLEQNYMRVWNAMNTFRSAHGVMARRLDDMARHYGTAAVVGRIDSDEVLDPRSGLTVADLRDCIDLLKIVAIQAEGPVPAVLLDRIHEDDEEMGS